MWTTGVQGWGTIGFDTLPYVNYGLWFMVDIDRTAGSEKNTTNRTGNIRIPSGKLT
jgi:hypothetical protein